MEVQAAELVHAAATGDEAAFTELVSRHHQDMLRVAYVICRDPALAEDAAQAAWAIAWRRIGDVKDPTQIRAGSWRSPRTRPAGRCGRVGRASARSRSATSSSKGCPTSARTHWPTASRARICAGSSQSLDPTDRALIALRYVAELSSDEIGRALGMSSSGARGRLSRLLLRLRGELRDA